MGERRYVFKVFVMVLVTLSLVTLSMKGRCADQTHNDIFDEALKDIKNILPTSKPRPFIKDIHPKSGPPGIEVTIEGKNFKNAITVLQPEVMSPVSFGRLQAQIKPNSFTDKKIVVYAPGGTGEVNVKVGGSNEVKFRFEPPSISSIIPRECKINLGEAKRAKRCPICKFTIKGENFGFLRKDLHASLHFHVLVGKSGIPAFKNKPPKVIKIGNDGWVEKWTNNEIIIHTPSDCGTGLDDIGFLTSLLLFALGQGPHAPPPGIGSIVKLEKFLLESKEAMKASQQGLEVYVRVETPAGLSNKKWFYYVPAHKAPPAFSVPIPSAKGLATALVMDVSGSMGEPSGRNTGERKIDVAAEAAKAFIGKFDSSDYCSLSVFSDTGQTVVKMFPQKEAKDTLIKEISKLSPQASTNFTAGLGKAYDELNSPSIPGFKKTAVFLSDGMHNVGPWSDVMGMVEKFAGSHWKIYTMGFGENVDEKKLREMASRTKGIYFPPAESDNIIQAYDLISSDVTGKTTLSTTSDYLARAGQLTYKPTVNQRAEKLQINTSYQGSKLDTRLVSPGGQLIKPEDLTGDFGRYEEGKTYQMLEVNHPESGQWHVKIKWAVPPPRGERVNVSIMEKTDVMTNILGFKSKYKIGEPVNIAVHAVELQGNRELPLKDSKVLVKIYKPGPEIIQAVEAGTAGWAMYKNVLQNNTRTLVLYDDGQHKDYEANDGIFSNTFSETDKSGPYIVVVEIMGTRENGEKVRREIKASFQTGPIVKNKITVSREMDWLENMSSKTENLAPQSEDLLKQPAKQIDNLLNKSSGSKSNKKVEDLLK